VGTNSRGVGNVSDINSLALWQETNDVLGTLHINVSIHYLRKLIRTYKAVSNTSNLLESLLLQIVETLLDDRVDSFESMGVLSINTFLQQFHDLESLRSVERNWVSIEQIRKDGIVSIGGVLIGHQLAVCPDTNHIGEEQNSGIFVYCAAGGLGDVGFDVADLDGLSGGLTSVKSDVLVLLLLSLLRLHGKL